MSGRKASVDVLAGGLQTTVQDLGRFGFRHLGVGTAGALDTFSASVANLLVGNPANAPVLEIALKGPRLRFHAPVRLALAGAELDARIGDVVLPAWRPMVLPAGSVLDLGACRRGAYAYLAAAGGFDVPTVLGSASTDLRAGFGGLEGRALCVGDHLSCDAAGDVAAPSIAKWWIDPVPDLDLAFPQPLRLLPGRDATMPAGALCTTTWHVGASGNRQGLRLQGSPLAIAAVGERVSEPVVAGTVQLPPDGQPIVLLGEAQTIGGYPRIGHVIAADRPRLAQRRSGDALAFVAVDAVAAHRLACEQRARLERMTMAIERRRRDD